MTYNTALEEYFEEYCEKVEITPIQLYSKNKRRDLVEKRMVLMYTLRKSVGMTYHKIASALKKNHATIMYGVKAIEDFIQVYPHIQKYYNIAEEILVNHKHRVSQSGKHQWMNNIGQSTWSEETPTYEWWKTEGQRKAFTGEETLINFVKAWANVASGDEVSFDTIAQIVTGDTREIK